MIAVVADDLTGAAELGGIGLRYGLTVEVALTVNPLSKADLLIISTDARSKSEADAVADMLYVSTQIAALQPRLIFKKIDSVLRGHIIPEIEAQLKAFQKNKALVVAANPFLGRTVVGGNYLIHGKPLEQTSFKDDPEFPAKSSKISELLQAKILPVQVRTHQETLQNGEITVGEAASTEDLKKWASYPDADTLLAGSAGFFSAILDSLKLKEKSRQAIPPPFRGNKLYVCGTAFVASQLRVAALAKLNGLVNYLPESVFSADKLNPSTINNFGIQVSRQIKEHENAIVAVNPNTKNGKNITALTLREKTAEMIHDIFQKVHIDELVIEGGSTANTIFEALNIKTLFPSNEYAPGVIRCSTAEMENLYITLKPGSYSWPKEVWIF